MAIRRGVDWGGTGPLPPDGVVVADDAEARAVVTEARRADREPPPLGLLGGDLCRTLGGRGDRARIEHGEATQVTVDLGAVLADGRLHWFVAHLASRRTWLAGPVVVAMNAQWLGRWNVAPRAHPGDGRLDTFEVDMGLGDRLKARARLREGSHLPHPGIVERRTAAAQFDLGRSQPLHLDGAAAGSARMLSVRVEPDALRVVV